LVRYRPEDMAQWMNTLPTGGAALAPEKSIWHVERDLIDEMVGARGFEPPASWSRIRLLSLTP
jgi:hypothetical protein